MISIVGTRQNTPQGKDFCKQLIEVLKKYNPIICSGLAKGIDVIAHRLAMENGLETVACLALGLERVYPEAHQRTALEICKQELSYRIFFLMHLLERKIFHSEID